MTLATADPDTPTDLLCMGLATVLNIVPYAMLAPQVVVRLGKAGSSAMAISIYGLTPFALILAMSGITPRALERLGLRMAHLAGLSLAAVALLATSLLLLVGSNQHVVFVGLAALLGVATALTWTSTEALIASRARAKRVGSVTALYQTGLGVAFAVGPFLPVLLALTAGGIALVTGGLTGAAILLSASGLRQAARAEPDGAPTPSGRVRWRLFGLVLLAAFTGGWFEVGLNAILPYIALDTRWSLDSAVMLVGALATGALISQLPIYFFADGIASNPAIRLCALVLLLGALVTAAAAIVPDLLWLSAVLLGGGGGALYTFAMIAVARSRDWQPVAALTAAAVSAYTLGAAIGPLGAGVLLDVTGRTAFSLTLALLPLTVLLMTFIHTSSPEKDT